VPFDIGHLYKGEQDRIRNGDLNPHEREKLMRGENPWPEPVTPKPPPKLIPLVNLFDEKDYQDTQRRLNKLVHGDIRAAEDADWHSVDIKIDNPRAELEKLNPTSESSKTVPEQQRYESPFSSLHPFEQ